MFHPVQIPVQQSLVEYCKFCLLFLNFGQRGRFDGNNEQQLAGMIGESVVKKYLTGQHARFHESQGGFDGGFDIRFKGMLIDVKTMTRTVDVREYFVNNVVKYQLRYKANHFVFASYNKNKNVLEVCGHIDKSRLIECGERFVKGSTRKRSDGSLMIVKEDLIEVRNDQLNNISTLLN